MNDISFSSSLENIYADQLHGFFVGWDNPPPPEVHLKLLKNSQHVVLAVDGKKVVGYITAVTDKTLSAYIPLLEVLPEYQKKGIGAELLKEMIDLPKDFYMIDLLCDVDLQAFYEQFGLERTQGMSLRNYPNQNGMEADS